MRSEVVVARQRFGFAVQLLTNASPPLAQKVLNTFARKHELKIVILFRLIPTFAMPEHAKRDCDIFLTTRFQR